MWRSGAAQWSGYRSVAYAQLLTRVTSIVKNGNLHKFKHLPTWRLPKRSFYWKRGLGKTQSHPVLFPGRSGRLTEAFNFLSGGAAPSGRPSLHRHPKRALPPADQTWAGIPQPHGPGWTFCHCSIFISERTLKSEFCASVSGTAFRDWKTHSSWYLGTRPALLAINCASSLILI